MHSNKHLLSWLGAFWWLIFLNGCAGGNKNDQEKSTSHDTSKGLIGISIMLSDNPFFNVLAKAAEAEANKHGYRAEILSADGDPDKQDWQVKDLIAKKASAIIITPVNAHAIGSAVKSANHAGIPVFMADTGCSDSTAQVVSTIATDNFEGGIQAGQAMIEVLGGKGGEVMILDNTATESVRQRVAGFSKVINNYNENEPAGKIEIVKVLECYGRRDISNQVTGDVLQAHPELAGIFGHNDPAALGAYSALEKFGKQNQVTVIGFDGLPEAKMAIKEGKIYADPIQFPDKIGQLTVQAILRYFEGAPVEPVISIDPYLYRKADAEKDPELL